MSWFGVDNTRGVGANPILSQASGLSPGPVGKNCSCSADGSLRLLLVGIVSRLTAQERSLDIQLVDWRIV
jgi:hypothetical protein